MLCPFPDGTIPIVYVNTFFSIFQYKASGVTTEGLVDDFWKTAARYLHCDRVSYSNDQYATSCEMYCVPGNCTCNGDLGKIEKGEAFSIVDVRSYNLMRFKKFRYTFPVDHMQYAFFEGRPVTREVAGSLQLFLVFSTTTFIMIALSVVALYLIRSLEKLLGFTTWWKMSIVFCFLFLDCFYEAVFQGNSIVAREYKPRTFNEVVTSIQSGLLAWGTRGEMIRESPKILGGGSSFHEPDIIKIAESVCHNESVIGSFFVKELYEVLLHKKLQLTCHFYQIAKPASGYTHSFEPSYRSFLVLKNTPRWVMDKLNFLVLSLFQYDHRGGIYLRRFTLGRSFSSDSAPSPNAIFSPINIALFKPIFIICGEEMQCPFPDGTIPVVYVNTFFALFRYKAIGLNTEGFIDDFWKTAALYLHCDRVSYSNDHYATSCELYCVPGNCTCDGDLGMIEKGEAFSINDVRSYNKMRFAKFKYTFPIDRTQYAFFEGRPVTREMNVGVQFFLVFSTTTFILIALSVVALLLIRSLERVLGFSTWWKMSILVSFLFLECMYEAEFEGNIIVAGDFKPRTFNEVITSIQSGKLVWGTRGEMIRESAQILGGGSSFHESDIIKIAETVCHNESVIGSFFVRELYEVLLHENLLRSCHFYQIAKPASGYTHSFEPSYRSFLVPRNTPRWVMDKLNFLVLSLFQYDRREGIYLRRFTLGRSFSSDSAPSPNAIFSPINIALFKPIFIICGCLLLCSFIVILVEIAVAAVIKRRRRLGDVPRRNRAEAKGLRPIFAHMIAFSNQMLH